VPILAGLAILFAAWLVTEWARWPDVAALARSNPARTAFIDRARAKGAEIRWQWVPESGISVHLLRAAVAAEDLEFFSHDGFSRAEMRAALQDLVDRGRIRGASTITQQTAKNLWLSPSRDPSRKLREAILTRQLERHLTKHRILEIYLNVAEFGPGIYGAEAAARHYFGVPAAALTEQQAAELAAGLPRPGQWHPGVQTEGYRKYVANIRRRMDRADFLWKQFRSDSATHR
jgi:monofunctional biosynthetic peptidoglycan transglycosylase